jgi:type IV secretion system protein VirD4
MRDLLMLRHEDVLDLAHAKKVSEGKALFHLLEQMGRQEADKHPNGGPLRQAADLVQGIGLTYGSMVDRELEAVLSTARTQTRFLDSPALRKVLTVDSVRLADVKRKPTTLYLCLPAGRMATHAKWLRIVINMALVAFEDDFKPKIPVLMLLDEFPVLGHMRSLEVAAGQMAGYGVKLWTVVQDLTQLQRIYGEKSWQTFAGNTGIVTFFANNDAETLKYISEALGQRSMLVEQPSATTPSQRYSAAGDHSEIVRNEPLLSPFEVRMKLAREHLRLLVLTPRELPVIIERVLFYRERELFKQ